MSPFVVLIAKASRMLKWIGIFCLVNNFIVAINWWLNLLSKIWLFLNTHQKISKISKSVLSFFNLSYMVDELLGICDYLLNKSCKTCMGTRLCCQLVAETGCWFILIDQLFRESTTDLYWIDCEIWWHEWKK